ncbi:MAG: response regulator transcription factor [Sedimentisphaerales bacterium]|nr:response regulator transcription factor [Sedimentisphaerales bacterium]
MSIKILIADKHEIVREALRSLIKKQPDMEIICEVADGMKIFNLSRQLKPDIIIIDIYLPILNGIDATKQIISEFPDIKIIALSMHTNSIIVSDMIKAGASGYILKDCFFNELPDAIRIVHNGGVYLSSFLISMVVSDYLSCLSGAGGLYLESLTERENKILKLLGEGENTKQIAQKMKVSVKSIEINRCKIIQKLNNTNFSDIAFKSFLGGLSSIEMSKIS